VEVYDCVAGGWVVIAGAMRVVGSGMEERKSDGVIRGGTLRARNADGADRSGWRTGLHSTTSPDNPFGYGRSGRY
jgi:hypothetical protein